MEIRKVISDLYDEKAKLNRLIAALEELAREDPYLISAGRSRRGRKFMNPQERREVSERMRRYWAERKAREASGPEQAVAAASAA